MSNILCIYYSRTGVTRSVMTEVAESLSAERVEISDGIDRSGTLGYFMCGMDAMRRGTRRIRPYATEKPLSDYDMVILGTPVWAGRCSSVMRGFLKRHGLELHRVAYMITRASDDANKDVFEQMDRYTAAPRMAEVSLRPNAVGYHFWRDQFLSDIRNALSAAGPVTPSDGEIIDFVPATELKRHRRRRKKEEDYAEQAENH